MNTKVTDKRTVRLTPASKTDSNISSSSNASSDGEEEILLAAGCENGIAVALSNSSHDMELYLSGFVTQRQPQNENSLVSEYSLSLDMSSPDRSYILHIPMGDYRCRSDIAGYISPYLSVDSSWSHIQILQFCRSVIESARKLAKLYRADNGTDYREIEDYHLIFIHNHFRETPVHGNYSQGISQEWKPV